MKRLSIGSTAAFAVCAALVLSVSPASQVGRGGRFEIETVNGADAVAREVLVRFRDSVPRGQTREVIAAVDADVDEPLGVAGLVRVRSRSLRVAELVAALSRRPDVVYVEPNFLVRAFGDPNDQYFPGLWGLKNIGQPVNGGAGGLAGSDIKATAAWDLAVGSASHVVAIVDTGIDYNHVDLASNVWSAPTAFTVTIGGVPITCQAGTHGFNAITRTCDPMDDHDHGTHVAGTIGAVANNGTGVAGVSWVASLMGLKFLDATGSGSIGDAIAALDFAMQTKAIFAGSGGANIRVLSNSWGGGNFSQALLDAVNAANAADMLFVAAAGNSGFPNDVLPLYPASYDAPNIVAVAATTNTDARAYFSNYGKNSVHLGAPGVDILSTVRGNAYTFMSGTSMATPHVSGAAAVALSHCLLDTSQLKATLVDSVDVVSSLASSTISGGRLNLMRALLGCSAPPETPRNLTATSGDRQTRLTWSAAANATHYTVKRATVAGGPHTVVATKVKTLEYTDSGLVNATPYYYVVSSGNVLGESGDSNEASATPQAPSDLTLSSFTAPSAGAAGASVSVSVTTKNQGSGPAEASTTRFYLSTSGQPDLWLNGGVAVPALAPGASSPGSTSLILPADLAPQVYYLVARADADNVLAESSKANNTSSRSFAVGPDLVVSSLKVPATGIPGTPFGASYTVKNGGADTAASSTLQFYWSANTTFDTGDTPLGGTAVGSIPPSGSVQGQITLTAPTGLPWATYYVLAVADGGHAVAESRETNNSVSAIVRIGGDLAISSLGSPSALGTGVPFIATDTTKNAGGSDIGASTTEFYLSSDAALSAADTPLGSRSVEALAAGATSAGSTTLTVPAGTALGRYYLLAKADGPNTLPETQENNNVTSRAVTVGPDLTASMTSISSPVPHGSSAAVGNTVTNKGGNEAAASTVRFYLSTDWQLNAGDVLLAETRAVPALMPGASSTASTTVTIPAGSAPGAYYLLAQADGGGVVAESSETNNVAYKYIMVE